MTVAGGTDFVGRHRELAAVRDVLRAVESGAASTLVVTGEAGVGKTALIDKALATLDGDWHVLRGAGLPLSSMSVPFLALRSAMAALSGDSRVPPSPLTDGAGPHSQVPLEVDAWISGLAGDKPVALVVDDLHWADQGTLDVLMYLIAGRRDRRLGLLATVRRDEAPEGHPMHRWLADVRRMPAFTPLTLAPLDRVETGHQLAGILGARPHESLVDEIFEHTQGNSYFNRLLVTDLDPTARRLPQHYPDDLEAAVLANWHGLPGGARELTKVIAIGGRGLTGRDLAELVADRLPAVDLTELLDVATSHAVLSRDALGAYWFHHPLQAEVLKEHLAPEERRAWHAVFAAFLESRPPTPGGDVERLVGIADHHDGADHVEQSYTWALAASAAVSGRPEATRLLLRAAALRPLLAEAAESRADILWRAKDTAALVGDHTHEFQAVEELLGEVVRAASPHVVAGLLVRRMHLRFSLGAGFLEIADAEEAVRLGAARPSSWQYGYALAALSHTRMRHGLPGVAEAAAAAVAVAQAAGHPVAMAYAATSQSISLLLQGRPGEARAWARRGWEEALRAGDWWAYVHGMSWELNATDAGAVPSHRYALSERRRQMEELGAPHAYLAHVIGSEAAVSLLFGNTRAATDLLRVALGSPPGNMADMSVRLASARLAIRTGHPREARQHLARVDELTGGSSAYVNLEYDAVRAEVLLWDGDPRGAFDTCAATLNRPGTTPTQCEWLVPLAGMALADLLEQAGADATEAEELRDSFEASFPPNPAGGSAWAPVVQDGPAAETASAEYVRLLTALARWYAAESARGHGSPSAASWQEAATLLEASSLLWEAAYAWFRLGEEHLAHGRGDRAAAATALRRSADLAARIDASPLTDRVARSARAARIPLRPVAGPAPAVGPLSVLTRREREILTHLVAGRTYAEIAAALFLSEKTVSSHISNMLRKTGAANRVELARLAGLVRAPGEG